MTGQCNGIKAIIHSDSCALLGCFKRRHVWNLMYSNFHFLEYLLFFVKGGGGWGGDALTVILFFIFLPVPAEDLNFYPPVTEPTRPNGRDLNSQCFKTRES